MCRFGPMDFNMITRRKNATRETTSALKAWLSEHKKNPYPTKGEKIMLAIITKMTLTQVAAYIILLSSFYSSIVYGNVLINVVFQSQRLIYKANSYSQVQKWDNYKWFKNFRSNRSLNKTPFSPLLNCLIIHPKILSIEI